MLLFLLGKKKVTQTSFVNSQSYEKLRESISKGLNDRLELIGQLQSSDEISFNLKNFFHSEIELGWIPQFLWYPNHITRSDDVLILSGNGREGRNREFMFSFPYQREKPKSKNILKGGTASQTDRRRVVKLFFSCPLSAYQSLSRTRREQKKMLGGNTD